MMTPGSKWPVSPPVTHKEVLEEHYRQYENGVKNGTFVPFVYPMASYGAAILLLYLFVPPRNILQSRALRYVTFTVVLCWHSFLINCCKSYSVTVGFGIGIVSAWGTIWTAVLLIFQDAKEDMSRIRKFRTSALATEDGAAPPAKPRSLKSNNVLKRRLVRDIDGDVSQQPIATVSPQSASTYVWQSYPEHSKREQLSWIFDAITNFRGMGWNWRISDLPTPPLMVQTALESRSRGEVHVKDIPKSRTGINRFDKKKSLLLHNAWLFAKGYIALDVLKVLMNRDPYFWGIIDSPAPAHLPSFLRHSAFLLHSYRLIVSMSLTWMALRTIFCFGPFVFVSLIGHERLGSNGEPWMYPDHFGSYRNVFDRGLAGWWGGWWHQSFRYAFQAGGLWTSTRLRLDPRSAVARVVQLFVAFALSGYLHASGSKTMMGTTSPWGSSFAFFLMQPVGILIETGWKRYLRKNGYDRPIPISVGKAANFLFAHFWLWMTASLLINDWARGGIFLFEPIMLSPLRGLGYGAKGDRFFCWGGRPAAWHSDRRWWLSGIAF